jgi:hypothetical protein
MSRSIGGIGWCNARAKGRERRMSLTITISTIPHKNQRYDTVGDWQFIDDILVVRVSDLGDWRMEYLVADHEVREALLCRHRGITEKQVDEFDFAWKGEGELGDDLLCPCRKEHFFATSIERLTAAELGVDWAEYEAEIDSLEWGD